MSSSESNQGIDNRKYARLRSNFPIEFAIVRLQGDLPGLDWQQGMTVNVGQEGMCIQTPNLTESTIKYFRDQNILLDVRMKVPPQTAHVRMVCDVVWYKKEGEDHNPKITTGLRFRSIRKHELDRIMFHSRLFSFLSAVGIVLCVIAFIALIIVGIMHYLKQKVPS